MRRLVFYVSGHGFGHATRSRELMAALRDAAPELAVHVRSQAPPWIFTERIPDLECSAAPIDVGILQKTALDVDLPASLAAHRRFAADWEAAREREAGVIRDLSADLVLGDVPALCFAAAARAGVPAAAVANFSWDWILEGYAGDDPRWSGIARLYREAYAAARLLYRLPFHGDLSAFPKIVDAPLLVTRSKRSRQACRADLGIGPADGRRFVLVSFGGFGAGAFRAAPGEDLSDYAFVGFGPAPPGFAGDWTALPGRSPLPHEDLMRACDAVLGKPGYGTVAEAVAHATRFLHLPRRDFREIPVLEAALARYASAHPMPREDFEAGLWRAHLDALFEEPPPRESLPLDGARVIAESLVAEFDLGGGPGPPGPGRAGRRSSARGPGRS